MNLRDGAGGLTPEGSEVDNILKGLRGADNKSLVPVGVRVGKGLDPIAMMNKLRTEGWFGERSGAWEAGAGAEEEGRGWNEFTDKLQQGNNALHPESGVPQRLQFQTALDRELSEAGVTPTDLPAEAIRKLAVARAAREADAANEARALVRLKGRADSLGVPYREGVGYDELLGDVHEREAMQAGEGVLGQRDAEIQQRLRANQHEQYLEHLADLGHEPSSFGGLEGGAGFGEGSQGEGALGPSGAGAGGADAAAAGAGGADLTPTFDAAAVSHKAAADAATKLRARIFDAEPNAAVLAKAGDKTQYAMDPGMVAAQYFRPGPAGYGSMRLLQRTLGDDAANSLASDYAAMSLKRAAERTDGPGVGTIDPQKFARWRATHQDALRALPSEVQARFADAAEAGKEVDKAMGDRAQAMKDAEADVFGRLINTNGRADVSATVGSILKQNNASEQMRVLADAASSNPAAFEGLRQAVVDHIVSKLIGNKEAGLSQTNEIKPDAFMQFVKDKSEALSHVFTPDELEMMQKTAADIKLSARSQNIAKTAGDSNTLGNAVSQAKSELGQSVLSHVIGSAAEAVPYVGKPLAKFAGGLASRLRQAGIDKVDGVLTRMMTDPEFARAMLAKVPAPNAPGAAEGLARASNKAAEVLRQASQQNQQQQP